MFAFGKLHENSYLKKEIWTKGRVYKEGGEGNKRKKKGKINGVEIKLDLSSTIPLVKGY